VSKIVQLADITLKPGTRERFLDRVRRHARDCVEQETGCLGFHVLIPRDEPDRVLLYEVYAGEAALKAHFRTPHLARYRADMADIVIARKLSEYLLDQD
jgi:quinol monooxygenase YgiN